MDLSLPRPRRLLALVLAVLGPLCLAAGFPAGLPTGLPAGKPAASWVVPVGPPGGPPPVVNGFDPPEQPWLGGHRGVDLAADVGAEVRAATAGTVTYAGMLAGRGVVVVSHGALRTTYEPVDAVVAAGQDVDTGTPIGILGAEPGHCAPMPCLHWGVLEGARYLDPLSFLPGGVVRLLPLGARTISGEPPPDPPHGGRLRWPVASPQVTSPFGMRVHPITGVLKLHDGTDFRAPCGTPILAAASGTVVAVGSEGAYGLQVTVRHGVISGVDLTTSYSHLSRSGVASGQVVGPGQVVGWSGTTGSSTGCHLHFMVSAAGGLADPMRWLPGPASDPIKTLTSLDRVSSGDGGGRR